MELPPEQQREWEMTHKAVGMRDKLKNGADIAKYLRDHMGATAEEAMTALFGAGFAVAVSKGVVSQNNNIILRVEGLASSPLRNHGEIKIDRLPFSVEFER